MARGASVLIVEPHDVYRRALEGMLDDAGDRFFVAGAAAGVREALAACAAPQAVLICVRDPSGARAVGELTRAAPSAVVVALSFREDGETLVEALRAGAAGYLPKRATPGEIIDALERALSGEIAVHPSLGSPGLVWAADRLGQIGDERAGDELSELTCREREVLDQLADGTVPAEVARRLYLSKRTVEGHLANVYRKLGVRSSVEAVQVVLRHRVMR